jgi:UDP-N-acetylmuramoyl-tripeptide--D-alanyl-D-alanine ligase
MIYYGVSGTGRGTGRGTKKSGEGQMKGVQLAAVARMLGISEESASVVESYEIDSRKVKPGQLFFALKGETVDGHAFLEQVAAKGAVGAVVSKGYAGPSFGLALIKVDDVLASLQELARQVCTGRTWKIVAVTGSVGKTTIKEFIATLLEAEFRVGKTPGNANSQTGVPLTILNAEGSEEVLVIEMGMSQPREMDRLVSIAPPDVVLLNRIALAHVLYFPDGLRGIAAAKAEILSHPKTTLAFLHAQTCQFDEVMHAGTCEKLIFGAGDYLLHQSEGNIYQIEERGQLSPSFTLPFQATHLVENFLGAAAVARRLGLSWEKILERAQHLTVFEKRFERIEREGVVYINDSYNANPESMRAALTNLPSGKRRIGVLGAMRELGAYTESSHREIAQFALDYIDELFCCGQECLPMVEVFAGAGKSVALFRDVNILRSHLAHIVQPGDVVLLKGSNSVGLWRLLD